MAGYRTTRFIPIIIIIIIIAIAVVALTPVIRDTFSSKTGKSSADIANEALLNTSADRSVSMMVRGPIVANENFRFYQIKITPNGRNFTVYKDYMQQPISNVNLGNNVPAYEQFVYALSMAKFMDSNELTGEKNDTRGVCATGYLYEFQIFKADKSVKKLWTTTCSKMRGSLGASLSPISNLFIVQVPDAQATIGDIW
ncbi:MAG: hypothetical protein WCK26_00335 [Candidatus Saccharibacteria bacterium]